MVNDDERMKVLVIGPSDTKSRGGMATVINGMRNSRVLRDICDLDIFASYIDGPLFVRLAYSLYGYLKFLSCYKQYDLFHIHTASFGSTFRKAYYLRMIKRMGKKAIVHIHGAKYLSFYQELSEKKKAKVLKFLHDADMVIALSPDWKDKFEETFYLTNCTVLENGIDTEQFEEAVTPPGKYAHAFAVMGRLGQRKGTYDLLEAMELVIRKVPDMKCYLAGDGEVEKVKALVQKRNLEKNVKVLGWIDDKEKLKLLKRVSIVVLPSYYEGLPMSLLEGMAAGKAIISTTVGGIPELIKRENGILITAGNVKAMADALIQCSSDMDLLKKMSVCNIRKMKEEFSMKIMHEKLADDYRQVMER